MVQNLPQLELEIDRVNQKYKSFTGSPVLQEGLQGPEAKKSMGFMGSTRSTKFM